VILHDPVLMLSCSKVTSTTVCVSS